MKALIFLVNKNCKDPRFPSFNKIVIEGKEYQIANQISLKSDFLIDTNYVEVQVDVTGEFLNEPSHMNPMYQAECFHISSYETLCDLEIDVSL